MDATKQTYRMMIRLYCPLCDGSVNVHASQLLDEDECWCDGTPEKRHAGWWNDAHWPPFVIENRWLHDLTCEGIQYLSEMITNEWDMDELLENVAGFLAEDRKVC